MKKIIFVLSLIVFVIFIILLVGQSSFFLHSNIVDNSDAIKQEEKAQQPQTENDHMLSDDTLTDKTKSGDSSEKDIKIDSGTYLGQIDNNFIEIAISGVPEEKATRVFMLAEELKDEFENIQLSTGETIKFQYYVDEYERNVLVKIVKIEN